MNRAMLAWALGVAAAIGSPGLVWAQGPPERLRGNVAAAVAVRLA